MAGAPQGKSPRASGAAGSGAPRSTAGEQVAPADGSPDRRPSFEFAKSILAAIVVFLFVRTFLVEAYRIPSGSMDADAAGRRLAVRQQLVYGPHVPFTNWHLPGYAEPKRRDVVVFVSPPQIDQPDDPTPILVKRLWGTPGDTLFMRNGILHINGDSLPPGLRVRGQHQAGRQPALPEQFAVRLAAPVFPVSVAVRDGAARSVARQLGTDRRPAGSLLHDG